MLSFFRRGFKKHKELTQNENPNKLDAHLFSQSFLINDIFSLDFSHPDKVEIVLIDISYVDWTHEHISPDDTFVLTQPRNAIRAPLIFRRIDFENLLATNDITVIED